MSYKQKNENYFFCLKGGTCCVVLQKYFCLLFFWHLRSDETPCWQRLWGWLPTLLIFHWFFLVEHLFIFFVFVVCLLTFWRDGKTLCWKAHGESRSAFRHIWRYLTKTPNKLFQKKVCCFLACLIPKNEIYFCHFQWKTFICNYLPNVNRRAPLKNWFADNDEIWLHVSFCSYDVWECLNQMNPNYFLSHWSHSCITKPIPCTSLICLFNPLL